MSNTAASGFEEVHPQPEYDVSSSGIPTSGLLTPPILYNLDTRRDSIASSHTSVSFGTCISDYSMPVTPTYPESPSPGRGFHEVGPHGRGGEMQEHSFHGLPLEPKSFTADENLYGPWMLGTPAPALNHPVAIHAAQLPPHPGGFVETQSAHQMNMEMPLISSTSSAWDSLSLIAHIDYIRQWNEREASFTVPESGMPAFWTQPMQISQATPMALQPLADFENDYVHISTPSNMAHVEDDWVHVAPAGFSDSNSFDDQGVPFAPLPQEVFFKKESSPTPVKHESNMEEDAYRLTRSIYVSPTGGKTVKKEQKTCSGVSKTKRHRKSTRAGSLKKDSNNNPQTVVMRGRTTVVVEHKGVQGEWNDDLKRVIPKERPDRQQRHHCEICAKTFQRQEHMARHMRTHDGTKPYGCILCTKRFNRNDNCVAHVITHVAKPGCKPGRNDKWSLEEVQERYEEQKMKDKILDMYLKALHKP